MTYKVGQIVRFNGANYVVMGAQNHNLNGEELTFLHIRNIVSNDIINVDATQVDLVDLSKNKVKNSFDEFEKHANNVEEDLIENKTEYLNSLFTDIKSENTEEFFNLGDTDDFETADIQQEATKRNVTMHYGTKSELVENFSLPRTFITPRRRTREFDNIAVNATFSDLKTVNVLPTQQMDPNYSVFGRNNTQEVNKTVVKEERKYDFTPIKEKTIEDQENKYGLDFSSKINEKKDVEWSRPSVSEGSTIPLPAEKVNTNSVQVERFSIADDITNLIKKDATDINLIVDPEFNESLDFDTTYTGETKKVLLEGFSDKANRYKEKQKEILSTGPIDEKKIKARIQESGVSSLLDAITTEVIDDSHESPTEMFLNELKQNPEKMISRSQVYISFKKLAKWLIVLVSVMIFIPILALITKIIGNCVNDLSNPLSLGNVFSFSLASYVSKSDLVASIFMIILMPTVSLAVVIYSTVFVVLNLKTQYRRLAFFNHEMQKESSTISSLQDFSNESSVFMLKLHKDNKEMKRQIKKLSKLAGANITRSIMESDKKEVH